MCDTTYYVWKYCDKIQLFCKFVHVPFGGKHSRSRRRSSLVVLAYFIPFFALAREPLKKKKKKKLAQTAAEISTCPRLNSSRKVSTFNSVEFCAAIVCWAVRATCARRLTCQSRDPVVNRSPPRCQWWCRSGVDAALDSDSGSPPAAPRPERHLDAAFPCLSWTRWWRWHQASSSLRSAHSIRPLPGLLQRHITHHALKLCVYCVCKIIYGNIMQMFRVSFYICWYGHKDNNCWGKIVTYSVGRLRR